MTLAAVRNVNDDRVIRVGQGLASRLIATGDWEATTNPPSPPEIALATQADLTANGSSGRELAYAESNAVTTPVTTATDLAGLSSITFTVTSRPVYVIGASAFMFVATAAATGQLLLTDGSNAVKRKGGDVFAAGTGGAVQVTEHITTPGTYTRKLRGIRSTGSGTLTIGVDPAGDAAFYQSLRAVEA